MSLIKELLEKVEEKHRLLPAALKGQKKPSAAKDALERNKIWLIISVGITCFILTYMFMVKTASKSQPRLKPAENAIKEANKELVVEPGKPEGVVTETQKELPPLVLNGIVFSPYGVSYAFINNLTVKEKDIIEGVEVIKIDREKVEVKFNDKIYELMVTEE